jgi:hypothetical protein
MAEGDRSERAELTPDERAVRDLAASQRELVGAITGQIDFYVKHYQLTPEEAGARAREPLAYEPEAQDADQVSWHALSRLMEQEPERGRALWRRLKDEARRELAGAVRAGRSLERPLSNRPYERAQFVALVEALRKSLDPRGALEDLLVQQMACAYDLHLRWQALAVRRVEEGVWQGERDKRRALENMSPRQRERYQDEEGWLPPRVAETEALNQAVIMADRYQRAFLRLMKAYRDNRRLFGALVVTGGQVNVAEQQVNVVAPNGTNGPINR